MAKHNPPSKNGVAGLIELMSILRSKDGCAWDNEQTHQSLIEYLLEESFEFAEAVESGDRQAIREELGDVLLQVVFHSRIAQEDKLDPFNIDDVAQESLTFGPISAADVSANETPLRDVRQLDPLEMRDRFALDEGKTSFYAIRDLDVDRYVIDGRLQQVILGARELNTDGIPNRTWVSRHLIYTHGCGLVAAPASRVTTDGRPTYIDLGVKTPQLYVGEGLEGYSIVGTNQIEQACPDTKATPYKGTGGVKLSSPVRRVAFALNFGEFNLFGSNLISTDSRIMWIRNVKERVQKIAPFFNYDADPYPAVVDGKVVWILDAFTTTSRYPNSQSANIDQLSAGSGLNTAFNYVRNSVKVVVDAYSGEATFYQVDANDPIANTWGKVFPKLLTPVSEASTELIAHFRYPEDLFRVQTNMYGRYQFNDPTLFFNRDAAWSVAQAPPGEPEATTGVIGATDPALTPDLINVQDANVARFEPYFTIFHAPGATETNGVFSMLRPFVPFSSDNARKELRALMVVSSDPRTYGELKVYTVSEPLPEGPATVAAEFGSDPAVSQQVTLLDQRGSRVVFGDLQMVPVGKGLVYVRPLFVRPDDASARQVFVRKILASYNNKVVIADDLTTAITRLFPGYTGSLGDRVGDSQVPTPDATTPDSGGTTATTVPSSVPSGAQTAPDLLAQAETLFDQADAALAQTPPDFATYQLKLSQARELIRQAFRASPAPLLAVRLFMTAPKPTKAVCIGTPAGFFVLSYNFLANSPMQSQAESLPVLVKPPVQLKPAPLFPKAFDITWVASDVLELFAAPSDKK